MSIRGPRSSSLRRLASLFRIGHDADAAGMSSAEAIGKARFDRRTFLGGMAAASALAVAPRVARAGSAASSDRRRDRRCRSRRVAVRPRARPRGPRADALRGGHAGRWPAVVAARHVPRPGRRAWWRADRQPAQDDARLGQHGSASRARTSTRVDGDVVYHFDGQRIPEATVVDEYRAFVAAMRADLRACSGAPTADCVQRRRSRRSI